MMKEQEIKLLMKKIKNLVLEINPNINNEKTLIEQLDSFSLIELMVKIENTFEINFLPEEFNAENFSNYLTLAKFVKIKNATKEI